MIRHHGNPTHQKIRIYNVVVEFQHRFYDLLCGGGVGFKIGGAVGVFRDFSPIAVGGNLPVIIFPQGRFFQVVDIIANGKDHLVGNQPFVHQIQNQKIRHLLHHQPGLSKHIGTLEHLAGADAVVLRFVGLDIRDGTGLPSPGVVDQKFRVDAKEIIEEIFIVIIRRFSQGAAGDVSHGKETVLLQLFRVSSSHPPKICQRAVVPQESPIGHLRQFGDAHALAVGRHMLCHNIHGDLAEIEVGADTGSGCDAGGFQHIQNYFHGQLPGR